MPTHQARMATRSSDKADPSDVQPFAQTKTFVERTRKHEYNKKSCCGSEEIQPALQYVKVTFSQKTTILKNV
jgi:hypothetical protein